MTVQLHFDGFYYSDAISWEDWHAGVRMHGTHYHFIRYFPNGDWLRCYRDHDFDFWTFSEDVTPELLADAKRDRAPRIGDADPLCTAGRYLIDGDKLVEIFAPDGVGGMTWKVVRQIVDDRLLAQNCNGLHVLLFQPRQLLT